MRSKGRNNLNAAAVSLLLHDQIYDLAVVINRAAAVDALAAIVETISSRCQRGLPGLARTVAEKLAESWGGVVNQLLLRIG